MKKMKFLMIGLMFMLGAVSAAQAQNQCSTRSLVTDCATNEITATGLPFGRIEVVVYTDFTKSTILVAETVYDLDANGEVTFSAPLPSYVMVTWLRKNGGDNNFVPENCGPSVPHITYTQLCGSVLPIKFISVNAKRLSGNKFEVTFNAAEDADVKVYKIMLSKDGINYVERAIIFPDGRVSKGGSYKAIVQL